MFAGHKELLNSGLCDVVVVSSPNMTHYQILMDIINHPKPHHVLVEKPLCTTVAHCEEVSHMGFGQYDFTIWSLLQLLEKFDHILISVHFINETN